MKRWFMKILKYTLYLLVTLKVCRQYHTSVYIASLIKSAINNIIVFLLEIMFVYLRCTVIHLVFGEFQLASDIHINLKVL